MTPKVSLRIRPRLFVEHTSFDMVKVFLGGRPLSKRKFLRNRRISHRSQHRTGHENECWVPFHRASPNTFPALHALFSQPLKRDMTGSGFHPRRRKPNTVMSLFSGYTKRASKAGNVFGDAR